MKFKIQPTDVTFGAIVSGIHLSQLTSDLLDDIKEAFLKYALLIFPGQNLSSKQQVEFAKIFGEIEYLVDNMETIPLSNRSSNGRIMSDEEEQIKLLKGNEIWHTDSSYMPRASKASVLSAKIIPEFGGQTEWADARAAYDSLEKHMREKIDTLNATHNYFVSQAKIGHQVKVGAAYGFYEGEPPIYPLVKIHPETNRPALYVGRHACNIIGMPEDEAEELLQFLNAQIVKSQFVWQHSWSPGDIAIWDNRCLLHRARPFDSSKERLMMHTRIRGNKISETALNYR